MSICVKGIVLQVKKLTNLLPNIKLDLQKHLKAEMINYSAFFEHVIQI